MRGAAILPGAVVIPFFLVLACAREARAAGAGTKVLVPADGPAAMKAVRQGGTCIVRRGADEAGLLPGDKRVG